MELICLENSTSDDKDAILVIKDCRYNLSEVVQRRYVRNSNIWYKLLETGTCAHHSSLFAIAPEDKTDENVLCNTGEHVQGAPLQHSDGVLEEIQP